MSLLNGFFTNIRLQIKLLSRGFISSSVESLSYVFISSQISSLCMYIYMYVYYNTFCPDIILSLHLTNMHIKHVNPYIISLTIECLYPFVYSSISATAFPHCHWLNWNEGELLIWINLSLQSAITKASYRISA